MSNPSGFISTPIPIHVGLMGHIDHGKTALARVLSERVSTAGLDKHPQARARGITIDLGFTMFRLDKFLVTLVDAPGHADLIRSVVAGASIIDAAILTVAADEGPKVQTGEHIIVLESMGIDTLVVAITKIDLVDEKRVEQVEAQVKGILQNLGFRRVEYVRVSAKQGIGVEDLRNALLRVLTPRQRDRDGPFLMPIDHAFHVKGHGTVVTGTVLRGNVTVEETIQLMPQDILTRVRSIQTFGTPKETAFAGDRVGINIPDIEPDTITRGNYLCQQGSLENASRLVVRVHRNPIYRKGISKGMILNAHVGMPSASCEAYPFKIMDSRRVMVEKTDSEEVLLALRFQRPITCERGMKVLLLRTDLGPTDMRIVGHGEVVEISNSVLLYRRRARTGRVSRVRDEDVLVEGLASKKDTAQRLVGLQVQTETGQLGVIKSTFGTKGVVRVSFDTQVPENTEVFFEQFVEERI